MKIIIVGANGMLGHDLVNTFKNYSTYSFNKEELDITKKELLYKKLKIIKPELVINAAAYTDVDGAESNSDLAYEVNAEGVKNLANSCKKNNSILVHISTDYVFDGNKNGYEENEEPNPINIYGKSKYMGEKYLKYVNPRYYLIRTSWLYGNKGKNFVDTILNLAKQKKELKVVNDQFGRSTYTKDLTNKIKEIVETKKPFGIYHITNSGTCTWFQFAKKIVEFAKLESKVKPITSKQLDRAAKRPKYSVLINTKLSPLRHWHYALKDYMGV